MCFKFVNLCELAMLIHIIGKQILNGEGDCRYLMFIDCLSQVEQEEETVEFDSSEKFRRLINNFTARTQTTILYSYRVNNSLFSTQYSNRPLIKKKITIGPSARIASSGMDGQPKTWWWTTWSGRRMGRLLWGWFFPKVWTIGSTSSSSDYYQLCYNHCWDGTPWA